MRKAFGLGLILVLLVGCAVPVEKECSNDRDCVPATCCHASEAVSKEEGPDCSGQICTAECVSGTIDCGQGEIACFEGRCIIEWAATEIGG